MFNNYQSFLATVFFSQTHNRKNILLVLKNLQYDRVSHLRVHNSEIPLVFLIGFIVLFLFHSSNWINVCMMCVKDLTKVQ